MYGVCLFAFRLCRVGDGCRFPETHACVNKQTCAQVGQNLSDPFEMEFPSLDEALEVPWGSLKDRWGPPPKPFVVAQGMDLCQQKNSSLSM